MLGDYVKEYAEAWQKHDVKKMEKIEKDLATVGMDRMTLRIAAKEYMKGELK